MRKMSNVKKSIVTAMFIALCVVLPMAFHAILGAGPVFLPMHIPVLLAGLICGWPFGLLTGIIGPVLSHLITGMPPPPMVPIMTIELGVYGLVAGLMMKFIRTKKIYLDLYISLITAMLIGRVIAGISMALIFFSGTYSIAIWTTTYFVTSLPGVLIQIVVVPSIVFALEAAKLIPKRYSRQ